MIMLAGRLADPASGQETLSAIDITVRRNAFGRQADSFETDLSIAGLHGGPYRGVFIRAPWAERVGEEAEALAAEPRTGKFVAVRQGPALATAFHPELTNAPRIHEPAFTAAFRPRVISTTLALAWVAGGCRAAYITDGDVRGSVHFAVGIALCQAAGAIITGLHGQPLHNGTGGLVAAADTSTHAVIIDIIRGQARSGRPQQAIGT
jgi:hypothetical protein